MCFISVLRWRTDGRSTETIRMLLRIVGVALTREVAEGLEHQEEVEETFLATCE